MTGTFSVVDVMQLHIRLLCCDLVNRPTHAVQVPSALVVSVCRVSVIAVSPGKVTSRSAGP